MTPQPRNLDDPGVWVERLEDQCRKEALGIRLRATADAEQATAETLAAANAMIQRRIDRLRGLREDLAAASSRIERDLVATATEIQRRVADRSADPEGASSGPR